MGKKLIIPGADFKNDALNFETIGKTLPSLEGLPTTALNYTYVYKKALPAGNVSFFFQSSIGSATFAFKVFELTNGTLTQVGADVQKSIESGKWVDSGITLTEGQYIGLYGGASIAYAASTDQEIPHLAATAGNVSSVDYSTDFATNFSFVFGIKTD